MWPIFYVLERHLFLELSAYLWHSISKSRLCILFFYSYVVEFLDNQPKFQGLDQLSAEIPAT